jgi:hypothetical protein
LRLGVGSPKLAGYAMIFARARIASSANHFKRQRYLGRERGGRSISILWKEWNAINRKHRCQGGHHVQEARRYIRVNIASMQISKRLLAHKGSFLTVLSVSKPRPRPIDCHPGPEYETKWDNESRASEKYFLSPFLPPHEGLRSDCEP